MMSSYFFKSHSTKTRMSLSYIIIQFLFLTLTSHVDFLSSVYAISVDWTSYSDDAELPMSQQWRDDMKNKLKNIDQANLTPEQKIQYRNLMARLNGRSGSINEGSSSYSSHTDESGPYPMQTYGIILAIVAFFAYGHWKNNMQQQQQQGEGLGGGGMIGGGNGQVIGGNGNPLTGTGSSTTQNSEADREAMRQARLRQFEGPKVEPMPNPWADG